MKIITDEQMEQLWDIYDALWEKFGYMELCDLRDWIDKLD